VLFVQKPGVMHDDDLALAKTGCGGKGLLPAENSLREEHEFFFGLLKGFAGAAEADAGRARRVRLETPVVIPGVLDEIEPHKPFILASNMDRR